MSSNFISLLAGSLVGLIEKVFRITGLIWLVTRLILSIGICLTRTKYLQ